MHYLISFRCYGTWLHGDERGSTDRLRDGTGSTFIREPHRGLERAMRGQLKHPPILLDAAMREIVERTIREVAAYRGWIIHALAVRSNHVHIVVSAEDEAEKVMNDFKAWATRRLREAELTPAKVKLWSRHGSTRSLWDERALAAACRYVVEGQGEEEMPA